VVFKGYPDGTIEFFDDKIEAVTGYPKEMFLSKTLTWTDLIATKDETLANNIPKRWTEPKAPPYSSSPAGSNTCRTKKANCRNVTGFSSTAPIAGAVVFSCDSRSLFPVQRITESIG